MDSVGRLQEIATYLSGGLRATFPLCSVAVGALDGFRTAGATTSRSSAERTSA